MTIYKDLSLAEFDEISQRNFRYLWNIVYPIVKDFNIAFQVVSCTFEMMWDMRSELDTNVPLIKQLVSMLVHILLVVIFESEKREEHLYALGKKLKQNRLHLKISQ